MTGMDFASFLMLLVISAVVSAALQYGVKFYIVPGTTSYLSKVVVGWLGAWFGSPVFGHWGPGRVGGAEGQAYQLYYLPAILGSLALLVLAVDVLRTVGQVLHPGAQAQPPKPAA